MNKYFSKIFDLSKDKASTDEIIERIKSGTEIKGTNMIILILAMFIASIGLNMNSTAVVIGAMLISPLMGKIMGIAYGIATYDTRYARNAFFRLSFQTLFCILASTIYFAISPIETPSSELLARTSPAIWDVLIAIFGGFAGIIGITREEKSNVIPGVAIATALMPPLCTAGYGLANHEYSFFFGALYLYFINCLFICLTSITVMKLLKLPVHKYATDKIFKNQKTILLTLSIITIIPSLLAAYNSVQSNLIETQVNNYINYESDLHDERQVVSKNINEQKKLLTLTIIGKKVDQTKLNTLNADLEKYSYLKDYKLRVIQNQDDININELEKIMDSKIKITSTHKDDTAKEIYINAYKKELKTTSILEQLNEQAPLIFSDINHIQGSIVQTKVKDKEINTFLMIVYVDNKISPEDVGKLKKWAEKLIGLPVNLYIELNNENSNDLIYGNGVKWQ